MGGDILMIHHDILIRGGNLAALDRGDNDVTALPDDATLIVEADWRQMCEAAGSEAALILALDVEDTRDDR